MEGAQITMRTISEIQAEMARLETKKADLQAQKAKLEGELTTLEESRRRLLGLTLDRERQPSSLTAQREKLLRLRADHEDLEIMLAEVDDRLKTLRVEAGMAERFEGIRAFRAAEQEQDALFARLLETRNNLDTAARMFEEAANSFLAGRVPGDMLARALKGLDGNIDLAALEAGEFLTGDPSEIGKVNKEYLQKAVLHRYHARDLPVLSGKDPADLLEIARGRVFADLMRMSQAIADVMPRKPKATAGKVRGATVTELSREDALSDMRRMPKRYHEKDLAKAGVNQPLPARPPVRPDHTPGGRKSVAAD